MKVMVGAMVENRRECCWGTRVPWRPVETRDQETMGDFFPQ